MKIIDSQPYTHSSELLYDRIVKLISQYPEILELKSAFELAKIPAFDLKGLDVTYQEVVDTLDKVQRDQRARSQGTLERRKDDTWQKISQPT